MPYVSWTELLEHKIPTGDFTAPWVLVLDTIRQSSHLQIRAKGRWTPQGPELSQCGPDGLLEAPAQTKKIVVPDCSTGALIGKFGGSSAALAPLPEGQAGAAGTAPAALKEGAAFAIGSYCVVEIPTKSIGPFYVSFNGLIRPIKIDEEVVITVSGTTATV